MKKTLYKTMRSKSSQHLDPLKSQTELSKGIFKRPAKLQVFNVVKLKL